MEKLESDLTGDFRAELELINELLSMQEILEVVVLVGVIVALFFSTRALIKATVQKRENEVLLQTHSVLENERKMLRALIDNVPDFMYVKDTESRFVVANLSSWRAWSEWRRRKRCWEKPTSISTRAELASAFYEDEQNVIRSGQPLYNREEKGFDSAGNKIHVLTTKVLLLDSEGHITGIAGIGRDITRAKKWRMRSGKPN